MAKVKTKSEPRTPKVTREKAIDSIREALLAEADEETSVCKVAAERGIFCRGFQHYGDNELRRRYDWIVRRRPDISRPALEEIANDWQLAQQQVHDAPSACDVQTKVHDTCMGWDDFTNEQLTTFVKELTGRDVLVS
jgi:hypothetical protein